MICALTTIDAEAVTYEVIEGEVVESKIVHARVWFTKEVFFGAKDRNVAGGPAFREAAREQEQIARQLADDRGQETVPDFLSSAYVGESDA